MAHFGREEDLKSLVGKYSGERSRRLQEALRYDPDTGWFTWKISKQKCTLGGRAGGVGRRGYRFVFFEGHSYPEHRLAWFLHFGRWPVGEIDHVNRVPCDNRLVNIREATKAQNMANSTTRAASGRRGVARTRNGKRWKAQITVEGKTKHLGTYDSEADASFAYAMAAHEAFGDRATLEI